MCNKLHVPAKIFVLFWCIEGTTLPCVFSCLDCSHSQAFPSIRLVASPMSIVIAVELLVVAAELFQHSDSNQVLPCLKFPPLFKALCQHVQKLWRALTPKNSHKCNRKSG